MPLIDSRPWLLQHEGKVRLTNPVCVAYGHPDLDKAHQFLIDFGMVESHRAKGPDGRDTICYRGYGIQPVIYISKQTPTPEFLGVFFEAASEADLEKATQVPGAGQIEKWESGGKVVNIIDPCGGRFHVVFGMQKREFSPRVGEIKAINYPAAKDDNPISKPRRGEFHRQFHSYVFQTSKHDG